MVEWAPQKMNRKRRESDEDVRAAATLSLKGIARWSIHRRYPGRGQRQIMVKGQRSKVKFASVLKKMDHAECGCAATMRPQIFLCVL